MNNEIIQTNTGLVIPEGIGEEQFFDYGSKLAKADKTLQWYIGDWYNAIPWGDKKAACEKVGLNYKMANNYGRICQAYKNPQRCGFLTFHHHQVVAALPEPQRLPLLQQAAEKHWSTTVLRKEAFPEQQSPAPKAAPKPAPTTEHEPEQENEMKYPFNARLIMANAICSVGHSTMATAMAAVEAKYSAEQLSDEAFFTKAAMEYAVATYPDKVKAAADKAKATGSNTVQAKIDKIVAAELLLMKREFHVAVCKEAAKKFPDMAEQIRDLKDKNLEQLTRISILNNSVGHLLPFDDYRFLLNVLHPDRTPTPEKQAKAFAIVKKLEPFINACKASSKAA